MYRREDRGKEKGGRQRITIIDDIKDESSLCGEKSGVICLSSKFWSTCKTEYHTSIKTTDLWILSDVLCDSSPKMTKELFRVLNKVASHSVKLKVWKFHA